MSNLRSHHTHSYQRVHLPRVVVEIIQFRTELHIVEIQANIQDRLGRACVGTQLMREPNGLGIRVWEVEVVWFGLRLLARTWEAENESPDIQVVYCPGFDVVDLYNL